jgi:hypothetical protein
MPPVTPWTPPAPKPSPTAGATTAAASATPKPSVAPSVKPSPTASPVQPTTAPVAALATTPLKGLPAPDLPAALPVADLAVANARSVRGSSAWTDVELVRTAWRHAGGGVLPAQRTALVATASVVPTGEARVGDVVVYGAPASHVGLYVGHGYMVDASPSLKSVVVRRVYASPTVRVVRLGIVK